MKNFLSKAFFLLVGSLLMTVTVCAQDVKSPKIQKYIFPDAAIVYGLSDNGAWALAKSAGESYGESSPRLINVATNEIQNILSADFEGTACNVCDVTNDGEIVVGSIADKPAYWRKTPLTEGEFADQEWILLEIPENWSGGYASAVTSDGKYAVGRCTGFYGTHEGSDIPASYEYDITACLWDLATGKLIPTPNLPTRDMTHVDQHQLEFLNISPDGRYILGRMDWSYISPIALFSFVYDTQTQSYEPIGFTENPIDDWTPKVDGLMFTDFPVMSPNGEWVSGSAYMVKMSANASSYTEYHTSFRYNVLSKEFEVFDGNEDKDVSAYAIDNEGKVYGATPSGVPLRDWSVRLGKYWIGFDQMCSQRYGFNFYNKYSYDYTGTPWLVNDDGTVIVSMVDPQGESYILRMNEPITDAANSIELLGSYTATPADGATTAKLGNITLTFTRNIEVLGKASDITLKSEDGTVSKNALQFVASSENSREVKIAFRTQTLTNGQKYTVEIPAGSICIKDDATKTNKAITLTYNGRNAEPIAVREITPAEGSELSKIEYRTQPICIRFDSPVYLTDSAYATLYREDLEAPICRMTVAYDADSIHIYPSTTQYLYEGFNYRVELCDSAVVDAGGNCGNRKISVTYKGSYVQKIDTNGKYIFRDDFSNTSQSFYYWMRYEGDHNTPMSTMKAWGFDADNQPWCFTIRESETSTDPCMASHSYYSPSGRSDDWTVTPQLNIPDERCYLSFDAQSYMTSKSDSIKVIILATDENISALSADNIARFKSEGKVVLHQRLYAGESDEALTGDWQHFDISLADYAGKNIYIAFVNDTYNQSAIFVDNVVVERDLIYSIALKNESTVLRKTSTDIAGIITIEAKDLTFATITLKLIDSDGKVIDTITESGLSLKQGDNYRFDFQNELPLIIGEENDYSIEIALDNRTDKVNTSIKSLAFKPTKRVVLEKMTGTTCQFCPGGIIALEEMQKVAGDQIIPVAIHTYTGDNLSSGLEGYSSALSLVAAPTARIDRLPIVASPIWTNNLEDDDDYGMMSFSNKVDNDTWLDLMNKQLAQLTTTNISIAAIYDTDAETISIPVAVKSAINADELSYNLFAVILEDGIIGSQDNNYHSNTDPLLGDWGKGGKYGERTVHGYTYHDVARATIGETFNGTSGVLPSTMTANTEYTATINAPLMTSVNDWNNAKAVVMLIDNNTGLVINAAVAKFSSITGIDGVDTDTNVVRTEYFSLNGAALSTPQRGVNIVRQSYTDGRVEVKKVFVK